MTCVRRTKRPFHDFLLARIRVRLLRELAATGELLVATHPPFPSIGHVAADGRYLSLGTDILGLLTACLGQGVPGSRRGPSRHDRLFVQCVY